MANKKILVLDFGSASTQNIVRRVRELGVYSEMKDYDYAIESIKEDSSILGIILSGSPKSVYAEDAYRVDSSLFELGLPILGVGYGAQLIVDTLGGTVEKAFQEENGLVQLQVLQDSKITQNLPSVDVWMSHTDDVVSLPHGFDLLAKTALSSHAAFQNIEKNLYGVEFHPEQVNNPAGLKVLENFLYNVCGAQNEWSMENFVKMQTELIREQVGSDQVILGLSGGVDSAVVAALLNHAIGKQLTCIFVDHGLMRKYEPEQVVEVFGDHFKINLIKVDAHDRFFSKLAGVNDPEAKRKIIGNEFVEVFNDETKKLKDAKWLAQGTIYSDVIESGTKLNPLVKSHHNVGGLPEGMAFGLVEPIRSLFKDEVRELGLVLGLPEHIVHRQPFPGPGIGIRVLGEVDRYRVKIVQDSDYILRDEFAKAGLDKEVWQYFTVLTGLRSVGVKNDARTYDYTLAIRAVNSVDGMSAQWARIPYDILELVSRRIIQEVNGINRIVYDITSKPPSSIEWE